MLYTLENKWWKHNASFFRGFMTTNARVVLKSICCTISSWFNDSHFLCFFLRFPTILWIMGHCPKIRRIQLLMLIFGAKIQINCRWAKSLSLWISVLFFSHFLGEKRKEKLHCIFYYYACHLWLSSLFRTLREFMSAWETTPPLWEKWSLHLWLNSVSFKVLRKYLNRTKEAHYQYSSLKEPQNDFLHEMKSIWSEKPWFSR